MAEYDADKPIYVWPVDMKGPDGNAFVMISHGITQLKKFGHKKAFIGSFVDEAMRGDYEHVKQVIKTYFNVVVPEVQYRMLEDETEEI